VRNLGIVLATLVDSDLTVAQWCFVLAALVCVVVLVIAVWRKATDRALVSAVVLLLAVGLLFLA